MARDAKAFKRAGDRPMIPTFELIVVMAQAAPGSDGDYAARVADAAIKPYYDVVRRNGGVLMLDIQPGRSPFLPYAKSLARCCGVRGPDGPAGDLAGAHAPLGVDRQHHVGARQPE